jgi:hypothetical protein
MRSGQFLWRLAALASVLTCVRSTTVLANVLVQLISRSLEGQTRAIRANQRFREVCSDGPRQRLRRDSIDAQVRVISVG